MFWSFILSFVGGLVVGVHSLFAENTETFATIVLGIVAALILGVCIWYLVVDLKRFTQIGIKIGRSVYILFLAALSFLVGFYLAMIVLIVAIFLFVLWVLWIAVFDKGNQKNTIKLSNGEKVTVEKGMCGETYYTGESGKEYETSNGDVFTEKQY